MGTLSHQVSLEHDVTQPAPTVTSQSERNRNVEKISTKPADSYPGTLPIRVKYSLSKISYGGIRHQYISSPTSVSNIDVAPLKLSKPKTGANG